MDAWALEAENFLQNETEFQLGFLPSEARNPLTMHLDEDFRRSTADGVKTLLSCDRALLPFLRNTMERPEYTALIGAMKTARRIIFSGCGATGRLAILLESMWLESHPGDGKVLSIMTGGDFALVKSVENFEDYPEVGKQQVDDLNLNADDLLIGITATGETASIVGSAREAALRGAKVFLLICVPKECPSRLARCRELYSMPNVTVIDMPIGGMAVTGSTRMQSSTIEFLIAASALEIASGAEEIHYAEAFERLICSLENSVSSIAEWIDFEYQIYSGHGLIDYRSDDLMIDILSDTTERSPTFMIPPYKSLADSISPEPWGMLRNDRLSTEEVWRKCLGRVPRCIAWTEADYRNAGLSELLKKGLPRIGVCDLMKIPLGCDNPGRKNAVAVQLDNQRNGSLRVNGKDIGGALTPTPLRLFEHLRMKLVMNIVSTGTMVKFGRVKSNYMIHLAISNKKLIDRACRIISELCRVDYATACHELFRTRHELKDNTVSPVAATIRHFSGEKSISAMTTASSYPGS